MNKGKCRGCGAEIIWTKTSTGASMPLDVSPVKPAPGWFVLGDPSVDPGVCVPAPPLHLNHWATCPNREQFKRGAEAKRG